MNTGTHPREPRKREVAGPIMLTATGASRLVTAKQIYNKLVEIDATCGSVPPPMLMMAFHMPGPQRHANPSIPT
eukprot:1172309-Prorocentrum_minimum.AAC.1